MSALLWLCFTISGAAALALEMLWMRSAGLILGQTAVTTATVLACYFGGLSLGAAAARGIRGRAVRAYGLLEIGAAAGALWSVAVFRLLAGDTAQGWLSASGAAGRLVAVASAILPATLCLGATLPALGQALAAATTAGRRGGGLYALNTLGGVAGIAAAGFGLPAAIGVRASYALAAAASAVVGVVALVVARLRVADRALSATPAADSHEGAPLDTPPRESVDFHENDVIALQPSGDRGMNSPAESRKSPLKGTRMLGLQSASTDFVRFSREIPFPGKRAHRTASILSTLSGVGGCAQKTATGWKPVPPVGPASSRSGSLARPNSAAPVGFSGRTDLVSRCRTFLRSSRVGPIFSGAVSRDDPVSRRRLRVVAAGAGALGIGLEVLWTRLFAQVLHNSVYSFSAIALVFLVAIAAGATVAATLLGPMRTLPLRRVQPASLATAALIAAALATIAGVWLFVWKTDGLAYVGMESGLGEYIVRIVGLAAVSVGPAALASGMVLPALWDAWGGHEGAARPLGDLSAANTVGGIAGAITAGFVGIPTLGVRGSLLAAAVVYVGLALLLAPQSGRWRPFAYAALIAVLIFNPLRAPLIHLRAAADGPGAETLRATAEGANGIVTVVETDGDLQLRLDNYYVLGGSAAATNERRLGLLPLLLHPAPHRVLFIGLATGITASAGPALGVDRTTVVELVPEVAAAARAHFATWNGDLLERRDVRLVLDDGRRYVAASHEQFDVIVSDLFIPWHAGAGNLYSQEMYAAVRQRLAPGGLFCQWLPLYQLTRDEFDMIARTFASVFPQVSLWRGDFYPNRAVVGLVGQLGGQPVDVARLGKRLEQLPEWSRDPLLATPRGLLMLSAGPLTAVADQFAAAALNTDDRPRLEFSAPRLTRINAAGDKDWFTGEALAEFYDTLAARTANAPDPLLPPSAEVAEAQHAGRLLYRYALAATTHDTFAATRLESQVRALVPDVIRTAESADSASDLAQARRTLDSLRVEHERVQRRLEDVEQRLGQSRHSGNPQ